MSACPKIDFEYEYVPAAGGDSKRETGRRRTSHLSTNNRLAWWHRALHLVAC
jgi:hypothetical protein